MCLGFMCNNLICVILEISLRKDWINCGYYEFFSGYFGS